MQEEQKETMSNDEGDFLIKNKPKQFFTLLPLLALDVEKIETSHKKDSFYSRTQTEQLLICLFLSLVLSRNGRKFKEPQEYYQIPLSEVIRALKRCTPQYLDYRGWIEALEFCGFDVFPTLQMIEEEMPDNPDETYHQWRKIGVREITVEIPVTLKTLCLFDSDVHSKFKELREKLGIPREICYPY